MLWVKISKTDYSIEEGSWTSAITGPIATCLFHFQMNDPAGGVASGMGTCGMVGPIGVYAGWVNDVATGAKAAITGMDWLA